MWKPAASSLDRSSAEWTGQRGDEALGLGVVVGGRYRHDLLPLPLAASKTARAMSAQDLTAPEPVQLYVP